MDEEFIPYNLPTIGDEEIAEVVDCLRSGWLTTGPRVQRFEEGFRQYIGSEHAVAVSSCTAALHLALAAAGIGEGDEVITTPLTFCASVNVILHQRARPVLADITLDDYNLDPAEAEKRITPRTRAIMPVHYAGQPCRMDELMQLARRHHLMVIEDAAHAVGARYKGKPIGTIGDATAFSFYATKNLTTGEGGMVTTDNADLAERIRLLTLHGISRDAWNRYAKEGSWFYEVMAPGFKYNMSDIQAAIGLQQLAKVEGFIHCRQQLADAYNRCLRGIPEIVVPQSRAEVRHAWHLYVIRLLTDHLSVDRSQFIEMLRQRGIGTSVHFIPIHHHPWYRQALGYRPGDFPNTDSAYAGLVSLPLYPRMSEADVERVAEAVIDIIQKHRR